MTLDEIDPKGLIREAYRIEGLGGAECRSIFLDWALTAPQDIELAAQLRFLYGHYGVDEQDHPMTEVLREGLTKAPRTDTGRRRRRRPASA